MGAYNEMQAEGHTGKQSVGQTASTTAVSVISRGAANLPRKISSWKLTNRGTVNILISTDKGTSFAVCLPYQPTEARANTDELQIKSASSTAGYDLYYTVHP